MTLATIITPSTASVKPGGDAEPTPRRHPRIIREPLHPRDVDPALRSLGRHIARRLRKGQRVRIPAMCGSAWGHVLRALEMKRSFN
jgi:hypothetical protein